MTPVTNEEARHMTKQQVIRALHALGVTDIVPHGKYQVEATVGTHRGLYDPRDLLIELTEADYLLSNLTKEE